MLKNREDSLDFFFILLLLDYQNPLLTLQWKVLETGSAPLALCGTKNFENVVC